MSTDISLHPTVQKFMTCSRVNTNCTYCHNNESQFQIKQSFESVSFFRISPCLVVTNKVNSFWSLKVLILIVTVYSGI